MPRLLPCLLPALLAIACVQIEPQRAAPASSIELRASDFRDAEASRRALPRRPRLSLRHPHALVPDPDAIWLLRGEPDADVRAALDHKPLRAEYAMAKIPCDVETHAGEVTLTPRSALDAGEHYTLAVAGWARTLDHAALGAAVPATFALTTAADPDAGARVTATWPGDGSAAVATNLEAVVITLDGRVANPESSVWLQSEDGLAVPADLEAGSCADIAEAHGPGQCVKLTPRGRLAPNANYTVSVGSDAIDAHGAPVGPFVAGFRTADGPDLTAPESALLTCANDELPVAFGCVLLDDESITLRLAAGEPVTAALSTFDQRVALAAPSGDLALALRSLPADTDVDATLLVRDAAGNERAEALHVHTLALLPTLAITEVRADPLGPEPAQEYVELLNYGEQPIDLFGLALEVAGSAHPQLLARSIRIVPQERVLLVADDFDPNDERDARPRPGTTLVRMGKALGGSGLPNAGSSIVLRDADGHRLSAAPASPRPLPGVCSVRINGDLRDGSPGTFARDPDDACSPGR